MNYTVADALTDALVKAGVSYSFVNTGTDYPPIIESWAKCDTEDRVRPEVIICPHEMVALSAAQGYAQSTGKAQAVYVHVDVGTQNLGGSVHNAARSRMPVFILSGVSPITLEGELPGTRDMYIQYIQNVGDQAGIVRDYAKWTYEIRTGKNIQQLVYRALQIARSEPCGPVYLMAAREVLEEEAEPRNLPVGDWAPIAPCGLAADALDLLKDALLQAAKPLIVTSYSGRNEHCVAELIRLSERLAIPVVEVNHSCMNFPGGHPMHSGYDAGELLPEADVVLIIDSDLPWIPSRIRPRDGCRVFYLDIDPLKEKIPLWYIPAERFIRADSHVALKQLNHELENTVPVGRPDIEARRAETEQRHRRMRAQWRATEASQESMTPEHVTACLREVVNEDTILLNETISHHAVVNRLLPRNRPGTFFTSGGSGLGWHGGAAIGVKLAHPDRDVVAVTGDGTYIFSCPTAVYWTARRYGTPFMTVVYNNRGWGAPRTATISEYPRGEARRKDIFWVSLEPLAQLDAVAGAAGGAFARTVSEPGEVKSALREGLAAVKNGRCAVINVLLPPVSQK
jgi:acetolactate synthase I/II/III large subunit